MKARNWLIILALALHACAPSPTPAPPSANPTPTAAATNIQGTLAAKVGETTTANFTLIDYEDIIVNYERETTKGGGYQGYGWAYSQEIEALILRPADTGDPTKYQTMLYLGTRTFLRDMPLRIAYYPVLPGQMITNNDIISYLHPENTVPAGIDYKIEGLFGRIDGIITPDDLLEYRNPGE